MKCLGGASVATILIVAAPIRSLGVALFGVEPTIGFLMAVFGVEPAAADLTWVDVLLCTLKKQISWP